MGRMELEDSIELFKEHFIEDKGDNYSVALSFWLFSREYFENLGKFTEDVEKVFDRFLDDVLDPLWYKNRPVKYDVCVELYYLIKKGLTL
jgi:hypothetical protein